MIYSAIFLLIVFVATTTLIVTNAYIISPSQLQRQTQLIQYQSSIRRYMFVASPPPPSQLQQHVDGVVTPDNVIRRTVSSSDGMLQQRPSALDIGIRSYNNNNNAVIDSSSSTTTQLLSLQERKIPTKEEIAQKKLTFNVIFWGGGFVAPFIATVFYFGFRFWEK